MILSPDGTEAAQATEDGMELEEPSKETQELTVPAEPELPSEFDKLFKGCEENPEDFNGWVYLLQYVEQEVRTHKGYSEISICVLEKCSLTYLK